LTIAVAATRPCEMMHHRFTPSSNAPAGVFGQQGRRGFEHAHFSASATDSQSGSSRSRHETGRRRARLTAHRDIAVKPVGETTSAEGREPIRCPLRCESSLTSAINATRLAERLVPLPGSLAFGEHRQSAPPHRAKPLRMPASCYHSTSPRRLRIDRLPACAQDWGLTAAERGPTDCDAAGPRRIRRSPSSAAGQVAPVSLSHQAGPSSFTARAPPRARTPSCAHRGRLPPRPSRSRRTPRALDALGQRTTRQVRGDLVRRPTSQHLHVELAPRAHAVTSPRASVAAHARRARSPASRLAHPTGDSVLSECRHDYSKIENCRPR